jgi:sulfur transfer protein SufE
VTFILMFLLPTTRRSKTPREFDAKSSHGINTNPSYYQRRFEIETEEYPWSQTFSPSSVFSRLYDNSLLSGLFFRMKFHRAVSLLLLASASDAFMVQPQRSASSIFAEMTSSEHQIDLGLTPELKRVTDAFGSIPDEQLRYKQLLYMAQNTKEANDMPDSSKTPENKVPGCLSTVYVDGTAEYSEEAGDYVIKFIGDSDGLLTRGLVALLVR